MDSALQLLRGMARAGRLARPHLEPVAVVPSVEEAGRMTLRELGESLLVLEVDSDLLGETVLFAGDRVALDEGEARVAYRAGELEALAGAPLELRLAVHECKRTFPGSKVLNAHNGRNGNQCDSWQ